MAAQGDTQNFSTDRRIDMKIRLIMAVIAAVMVVITSPIFSGIAIDKTEKTQVPGVYPFKVGDFTITALSDGTVPQDLPKLLTNTNPAEIDRLQSRHPLMPF
jgi:hypothetical protein